MESYSAEMPKNVLSDFQEKAKFSFVWRITIVFSLTVSSMALYTFLTEDRFFLFYLTVGIITSSCLVLLHYFKKYKPVVKVLLLTTCVVLNISIYTIPDALHIQEALWMVVIILTAFFTLGNAWGTFYLIVNTILYAIYYNFLFAGTANLRLTITPDVLFFMSIEFTISMFLIGFVMYQYSLINRYALKHSTEAYENLIKEKQLVEHQNKEKTVLLQEIHHRVKNNLQVIVSLLRIQSRDLKSEEAKNSFQDAITRILTMSLIHQKLYEKDSLMNLDIKDYISTLIKNLIETGSTQGNVEYVVTSSLKSVGTKGIVPLGLIINELVSNSLKHAFKTSGKIELTLTPDGEDGFKMTYYDNGRWIENDSSTFGTQLIEIFTEQLDGSYERKSNDEGTYYYFTLKKEPVE
ncbi:sensor histidine kinase [Brumimicrobium sp.]|uniref:sensor histidine kinase n=1 Tax=Brumimicrobium sp. TaxID=2029867 RepID=UPI003A92731F